MSRPLLQIDVFGSASLGGNPVAVVVDSTGLDTETMQRFAAWTNLSETTFLSPPSDPASADYAVRIFTPAAELPFAGHPTLGSAHAWLESGGEPAGANLIRQECPAGIVEIRRTGESLAFAAPPLLRYEPADAETLAELARALRLDPTEIRDAQWVDNGPGWVAVLLESAERVLALSAPEPSDLEIGVVGLYADGATPAAEVRAFFQVDGASREDPVTGSLNASLAHWLGDAGHLDGSYVAAQGTALGRSGRVALERDGDRIWVGGATRTVVRGVVDL